MLVLRITSDCGIGMRSLPAPQVSLLGDLIATLDELRDERRAVLAKVGRRVSHDAESHMMHASS